MQIVELLASLELCCAYILALFSCLWRRLRHPHENEIYIYDVVINKSNKGELSCIDATGVLGSLDSGHNQQVPRHYKAE